MGERVQALEDVLRGLRSEDDSTQLRAIIASVEAMRDNALAAAPSHGPDLREADELALATAIHETFHYGPPTLTCMTKHRVKAKKLRAALSVTPDRDETAPEAGDNDKYTTRCVCGREIFRPWIEGVLEPWKHWVEPLDHTATPAEPTP